MSTNIQFTNLNFTKDTDGNITGVTVPVTATSQINSSYYSVSGTYSLSLEELTSTGFDVTKFKDILNQKVAANLSAIATDLTNTGQSSQTS